MVSTRRTRDRRPARGRAQKQPRRRLLAVCEGKITEPQYLREFERWARNATVRVELHKETGDPKKLVEIAKQAKHEAAAEAKRQGDTFLAYDEVWCVFDRDEHPRFHEAIQMARDNAIEVAASNPCFELWLLLHIRDQPGAQHRHVLQDMLKTFLPDYDKHIEFLRLESGISDAEKRAARLDEDAAKMDESGRNPTTGVYRLTKSISKPPETT